MTRTTDSHLKRIISTNCCIRTVVTPDDGPRYARNILRLTKYTGNKLCIKLVFSLHVCIEMYCQQKTLKEIRRMCKSKSSKCSHIPFLNSFIYIYIYMKKREKKRKKKRKRKKKGAFPIHKHQ